MPRKLHLGDGKLGAHAVVHTLWEGISASSAPLNADETDELLRIFGAETRGGGGADGGGNTRRGGGGVKARVPRYSIAARHSLNPLSSP